MVQVFKVCPFSGQLHKLLSGTVTFDYTFVAHGFILSGFGAIVATRDKYTENAGALECIKLHVLRVIWVTVNPSHPLNVKEFERYSGISKSGKW